MKLELSAIAKRFESENLELLQFEQLTLLVTVAVSVDQDSGFGRQRHLIPSAHVSDAAGDGLKALSSHLKGGLHGTGLPTGFLHQFAHCETVPGWIGRGTN